MAKNYPDSISWPGKVLLGSILLFRAGFQCQLLRFSVQCQVCFLFCFFSVSVVLIFCHAVS